MNSPLIYDFRSLASAGTEEAESAEDLNSVAIIDERMADVCRLFSIELFEGFYNVGKSKIRNGCKRITLQRFRTQGIDARLVIYKDEGLNILGYFICHKGQDTFKVMRFERFGQKVGSSTDLYWQSGIATHNPIDIAFLREVTETLAADIKATFDSVFKA